MDARVVFSVVLLFVGLVEVRSHARSEEPVENSGSIGTFWNLLQQLFKLEGKVENQLKNIEDDIEELKSKVENGAQEGWKEETGELKTEIENLSQEFERAKSDSQALEAELVKVQESNAALTEGITALEESNSELRQDMATLQKSNSELQKAVSQLPSTERLFLCEHNGNSGKGSISCSGKPGTYLHIEFAHYGRRARGICVHPSLPSTFTGCNRGIANSLEIVRRLCQGKASCRLQAHNGIFGDPCNGTTKYLEVQYTCKSSG